MSTPNYVRLFKHYWRTAVITTVLGALLAIAFSFAQPLRYSSTERILITQANESGVDPYTAIKSTERIAQNLSQIIYTSSFFNAVVAMSQVDPTYFPTDEITKRELWQKTVDTSVISGTGVMSIVAYHTNRDQATMIAVNVAKELAEIAPTYFGYSVHVQIIDDPLPSRFFAKPDLLKNGLLGAIIGLLLGCAWILSKARYTL